MSGTSDFPPVRPVDPSTFAAVFRARDTDANKGTYGSAALFGGATAMAGAILLAGRSALKSGCGRVYLCFAQESCEIAADFMQPELMIRRVQQIPEIVAQIDAWGIGCGLGQSAQALLWLQELLKLSHDKPRVLDADALNFLADAKLVHTWNAQRTVLTPHPGEAARLLNCTVAQIQADRAQSAREISNRYRAWTVLKGENTVISTPKGECFINPTGHVALATAGTGDVLTGLMTSFLAQGHPTAVAVTAAVWLHGAAGEKLAEDLGGPVGATAGEVIDRVRSLLNQPLPKPRAH